MLVINLITVFADQLTKIIPKKNVDVCVIFVGMKRNGRIPNNSVQLEERNVTATIRNTILLMLKCVQHRILKSEWG